MSVATSLPGATLWERAFARVNEELSTPVGGLVFGGGFLVAFWSWVVFYC